MTHKIKKVVDNQQTIDPALQARGDDGELLGPLDAWGVTGAKIYSGYVDEEFLTQLKGDKGRKIYREMRDNDSTIGSIMFAVEMLLRAVPWSVEIQDENRIVSSKQSLTPSLAEQLPSSSISDPETAVDFVESVFSDMRDTWEDFIANVVTMLTFGWQYTEVVFKRRMGPHHEDLRFRSLYDDGLIGIQELGNRAQETIDKWELADNNARLLGMYQYPPEGGATRYIPYEKSLLFRPTPNKDSPEGRSVLRNAYRPWYFLKKIQEIEAIAIEREMAGLPVVYIPNSLLSSTDPEKQKTVQSYISLVRDIKFNSQGGVVLPSDTFLDGDGNPTTVRKIELKLLNAAGTRAIDTNKTVIRYQTDIARTILADFIMLGQNERGSFALSRSKTDLFLGAIEGFNNVIAAQLNRRLLPMLWSANGFDPGLMPYMKPGRVAPEDIEELGAYVERLSRAGFVLAPDDETENRLRSAASLPDKKIDDEFTTNGDPIIIDEEEEAIDA